jgi:hypothetical protein
MAGKKRITAAVAAILAAVFAAEGGWVHHPNDPGGETNHGITEAVARGKGYKGSMRDLPKWMAQDWLIEDYIEKPGFMPIVEIDPAVGEEVIDTAVNMGPPRPTRFLQQSLNELGNAKLKVDGQAEDPRRDGALPEDIRCRGVSLAARQPRCEAEGRISATGPRQPQAPGFLPGVGEQADQQCRPEEVQWLITFAWAPGSCWSS